MMSLRGIESLGANQMRTLLTFTLENPELVPKKKPTTAQLRRQITQMERELSEMIRGEAGNERQVHLMHLPMNDLANLADQANIFMPDDLI